MRIVCFLSIAMLLLLIHATFVSIQSLAVAEASSEPQLPTKYPLVYIWSSTVEKDVGENFTIEVRIHNLTDTYVPDPDYPTRQVPCGNLYGVDLQLGWDPSILTCVNYTKKTPIETHPGGVMHSPTIPILNNLNESGGLESRGATQGTLYWLAEASISPASVFNGNGTIVELTFNVLKKGRSPIRINYLVMVDKNGNYVACGGLGTWLNPPRNGTFSTPGAPYANFTYSPGIGVANKTMTFNATSSQSNSTIAQYTWDFGDGTKVNTTSPFVGHVYNASKSDGYAVSLKVIDDLGVGSNTATYIVNIATARNLRVTHAFLSQSSIGWNKSFNVTATVDNQGTGSQSFYENATTRLYYNVTAFDLGNVTSATWVQMDSNDALIMKGAYKLVVFTLNSSSLPTLEAHYYFLANVSGIPAGYEENTTDNFMFSEPLLYTDPAIPELPSAILLSLMTVSAVAVALQKRLRKRPNPET